MVCVIVWNVRYRGFTLPSLATDVLRYLHEVLGIDAPGVEPWTGAGQLPYFLQDAFQFCELELLGQPVILAMAAADARTSLSEIRLWVSKVGALAGHPVVYVTDALPSYDRRRLIEQKVPFIVPGNQLYLPDLGLDLREHFRQRATPTEALSPSAQAMLISALLHQPWQSDWQPSSVAAVLGYTPMTVSRAVKELTGTGLATAYTVGRSRWLKMEHPPEQIWERAKPMLRTPVKRVAWVAACVDVRYRPTRMAGLSALARHSMLTEPRWPVYAMAATDWKVATEAGIQELPEPEAGAQQWQLWSYSPALMWDTDIVDPLSLTLSLQDSADDRVQLALDELKGLLPW